MPFTPEHLESKLKEALSPSVVKIEDLSDGCGAKFSCLIVSEKFQGVQLLQRHRMVNEALAGELKEIHAFTMKTLTPEQWQKQNANSSAAS